MILKLIMVSMILESCNCYYDSILRYDRLPNNIKPISYDLHIWTNVHEGGKNLNGTVQILIQVLEDTNKIILRENNIDIIKLSLIDVQKVVEIGTSLYKWRMTEKFIIKTGLKLLAGKEYSLIVSYEASQPCIYSHGFCIFYYNDTEDAAKKIPLAATKFNRGNARLAFPCFDEPALKANFTISITHGSNYTALSNMPRQGEPTPEHDGYVTTHFVETPPMSTHLVAFTVSNFENITEKVGDTDIRLFFKPNSKVGRTALETSKKVFVLMNEYFNISFPLPKIDHFGVPGMKASAMESWGLMIYPEEELLDGLNLPSKNTKNIKTLTVKMVQMLFGNLVTPAWWSLTWLSEGISTYYAYKFINLIYPEFNLKILYELRYFLPEVCSLTCDARFEWLYDHIFNEVLLVPQVKGAFFTGMFERLLTEKVFRKGMTKYLKDYQYSSVTEDDLFDCLADSMESGSSNPYFKEKAILKRAMKSWSTQKYFPLVTVTRDYKNGTFYLKQEGSKTLEEGNGKELWWIPITFTTSTILNFDNITADFIFPDVKQMQINPTKLGKPLASNDWLILNKESFGLYVNYDERNWNLITCALLKDPSIIPEITKTQIIKNFRHLLIEGYVQPPLIFNFLSYLKNETEKTPWYSASAFFEDIFRNTENYEGQSKENLRQFIADIISNVTEFYKADENSENFEISSNNEFLFKLACRLGLEKCGRLMDVIFAKTNSTDNLGTFEKRVVSYANCYNIKRSKKNIKDIINYIVNRKKYNDLMEFFPCHKNKDNLKDLLKRILNGTTDTEIKSKIIFSAMKQPASLEAFAELLEEGDSEMEHLFLMNAGTAIYKVRTRAHKNMVLNTWLKLGPLSSTHRFYDLDLFIEKKVQTGKKILEWLKTNPPITNIIC